MKPIGFETQIMEWASKPKGVPYNTVFLRIAMSFSKGWMVVLKSSIKALMSAFKPITLSLMNLSWASNKFCCTWISPTVCSAHDATVPSSLGHSPNNSSNREILSLKDLLHFPWPFSYNALISLVTPSQSATNFFVKCVVLSLNHSQS